MRIRPCSNNSSFAACDQVGKKPRPEEICHLPPDLSGEIGNGRTYTSHEVSREAYATQRPSGEKTAWVPVWVVSNHGSAVPNRGWSASPSMGAVQMWKPFPTSRLKARRLPSGENDVGTSVPPSVRR